MKEKLFLKVVVVILLMSIHAWGADLRKGPYLIYTGTNTQMKMLWQLYETQTCKLTWRQFAAHPLGSVVTREYGTDHQHAYVIQGLTPGAEYHYTLSVGDDDYTGSFYAAPAEDDISLKFMVYGDSRLFPDTHNEVAGAMVAAYMDDPGFQKLVISVGDLVTDGDNEMNWDLELFDPQQENIHEMMASLPLQSCMGNHDLPGDLFKKYLPYPYVTDMYWSFDYGPAHFAIIDQFAEGYGVIGNTQIEWLEDDLALTEKKWKFIVLHGPGYGAGTHANVQEVQDAIQPLCEDYNVSIVFAGHNHNYSRAVVNGVNHVTSGGGGCHLYPVDVNYPFIVAAVEAHHFCKIDINRGLLTLSAETIDGIVLDKVTISAKENDRFQGDFSGEQNVNSAGGGCFIENLWSY